MTSSGGNVTCRIQAGNSTFSSPSAAEHVQEFVKGRNFRREFEEQCAQDEVCVAVCTDVDGCYCVTTVRSESLVFMEPLGVRVCTHEH